MLSQTLSLCYKTRFWPEATNADGDTALHIAARCQNVSGQKGFKWGVEKREQFFGFPWEERITNDGWRFLDGEVMYDKQINYLQFKMQNSNIMVGQTIAECLSCCTWLYVFLSHMLWCILYIYVYIYMYIYIYVYIYILGSRFADIGAITCWAIDSTIQMRSFCSRFPVTCFGSSICFQPVQAAGFAGQNLFEF